LQNKIKISIKIKKSELITQKREMLRATSSAGIYSSPLSHPRIRSWFRHKAGHPATE